MWHIVPALCLYQQQKLHKNFKLLQKNYNYYGNIIYACVFFLVNYMNILNFVGNIKNK